LRQKEYLNNLLLPSFSSQIYIFSFATMRSKSSHSDRCCFGSCCHVTTCVYIIGSLQLIGLLCGLISSVVEYAQGKSTGTYVDAKLNMIGMIIGFVIGLAFVIMLFLGVSKERPCLLIPYMVVQVFSLIGFLAGAVIAIVAIVAARKSDKLNDDQKNAVVAVSAVAVVSYFIALIIQIFFLTQVIKCYRYLKEKCC